MFLCAGGAGKPRRLKLIDFGLAKVLRSPERLGQRAFPTEQGLIPGSASALSPEQARGLALDARADLYAVALVLYIMVAGRHPFAELSGTALLHAYSELDPPAPSRFAPQAIPPILDALILQALARDPDSRFHEAIAFRAALKDIARDFADDRPRENERHARSLQGIDEPAPRSDACTVPVAIAAQREIARHTARDRGSRPDLPIELSRFA